MTHDHDAGDAAGGIRGGRAAVPFAPIEVLAPIALAAGLPGEAPSGDPGGRLDAAEARLVLGRGDIHIWYVFPDRITDPDLLAAYDALMTPEERARQQRFVFAKDRHQHLVTRALVRTVLSRYAPVAPAGWRFAQNAYGKPAVCGPPGVLWPCFNLSHTGGLIACAISASHEALGVDVEDTSRTSDVLEIAHSVFSPVELHALRSLPAAAQRDRFFAYWTLKESYIKARGMGLSLPLEQFTMHVEPDMPVRISCDPRLADIPARWRFALLRVSARHLLAVGVRCDDGTEPVLRAACHVPLPPGLPREAP